jgi:hypothetical protein
MKIQIPPLTFLIGEGSQEVLLSFTLTKLAISTDLQNKR